MNEIFASIICVGFLTLLFLFFYFMIKRTQDAKNKVKQARAERDEIDRIFDETPTTGFTTRRKHINNGNQQRAADSHQRN